jgi:hypothetical protein
LRRIIWAPRDEGNLVSTIIVSIHDPSFYQRQGRNIPGAFAALKLVLHIEDSIAASDALLASPVLGLCIEQLLAEIRPFTFLAGLFNHNLFPVVTDLVDDPFDVLAEFELVKCGDAFGGDGDSAAMLEFYLSRRG